MICGTTLMPKIKARISKINKLQVAEARLP
jgi:hypothetical protein